MGVLKDPQCVKRSEMRTPARWGLPTGESEAGEQCCETQPTPRASSAAVTIHQRCAVLARTSERFMPNQTSAILRGDAAPLNRPESILYGSARIKSI